MCPGRLVLRLTAPIGNKATRLCPCGFRLSQRDCRCDDGAVARYAARMSGPLLDRIDLHVQVPAVAWRDLAEAAPGPESEQVRAQVVRARARQARRREAAGVAPESDAGLDDARLDRGIAATPAAQTLLGRAMDRLGLSARALRRALRVARTIADLAGEPRVEAEHAAEAIGFRDPFPRGGP